MRSGKEEFENRDGSGGKTGKGRRAVLTPADLLAFLNEPNYHNHIWSREMKTILTAVCSALLILGSTNYVAAQKVNLQSYEDTQNKFSLQYPSQLIYYGASGSACVGTDCKPVEAFSLRAVDPDSNGTKIVSMNFNVQKNINPDHLPIDKWYLSLSHSPLTPSEKIGTVGGKQALQQEAKGTSGVVQLRLFVPLSSTDVLSISYESSPGLQDAYRQVISSIKFLP